MKLEFLLEAHIKNPLKKEFDTVSVVLELDAIVRMNVDNKYHVTGKLEDIDMRV